MYHQPNLDSRLLRSFPHVFRHLSEPNDIPSPIIDTLTLFFLYLSSTHSCRPPFFVSVSLPLYFAFLAPHPSHLMLFVLG